MEITMALTDASEFFCLVCSTSIDLNSCTNIFYVSLPHNGEILATFIQKVLKFSSSDLRSSYVCLQCYNLFKMLEQAQWTAANIQCEILKIFRTNNNQKLSTSLSAENISRINEITENFLEAEKSDQINGTKILITESILEKDFNSLGKIDHIANDIFVSNGLKNKVVIEHHIVNDIETKFINCTPIKHTLGSNKISEEAYKSETININNEIPIFSDEIIKNTSIEDRQKIEWRDLEDNANSQNNSNVNKTSKIQKTEESVVTDLNKKLRKSGRVSKYSQKPLKHTCDTCGKKWRTYTELKIHLKSHSNLRPYMCEKCGQAYKHKYALEIHVGMHNGVSPFCCSYCNKCFTQKGALQRHLPIHTGEMPYQCELCGKRFVHHTSYNMHTLSHTGKKSYKCDVCKLSLLSTSHLKRHMRVHTGEKPYSCDVCGKSFAERYNLLAHQKIHDPLQISAKENRRNQHKCDKCDLSFAKKQQFEEHLKEHIKQYDKKTNSDLNKTKEKSLQDVNGADLLESCVNEVWQSLALDSERLKS